MAAPDVPMNGVNDYMSQPGGGPYGGGAGRRSPNPGAFSKLQDYESQIAFNQGNAGEGNPVGSQYATQGKSPNPNQQIIANNGTGQQFGSNNLSPRGAANAGAG